MYVNLTIFCTAIIIALSFFGEAIFGFGSGLIAVPLVSLLIGVRDAVTVILIFQFCMGLLLWKAWEHIDWHIARVMTPTVIIGAISGTLLLSKVSAASLELLLVFFIVGFLIKTLWFDKTHTDSTHNKTHLVLDGLAGGAFQGLIGTGGTVFIMYLSRLRLAKAKLRATLIYLLFLTSLIRILISAQRGLFTPAILHIVLVTLPLFLIAIFIGHSIHDRLGEKHYKYGINIILALSAVALLIKIL